ncbi:MAG TPA: hypothetical protein VHR35_15650 [Nocardioides sp.]|jgi:hypothetical protein|nr:hypothetical protein [Nocardioides sp.]
MGDEERTPTSPEHPRRERLLRLALWTFLFVTVPLASALVAVQFAPPAQVEIAGQDVAVRPVLGQDTSRLQNGALVRPEHTRLPVVGIDVGVDVSADWNRLIPSDKQTRQYLVALWDDPAPEIDRIRAAARAHVIEWGLVGLLVGALVVGGAGLAVRERRARLACYTAEEAALVSAHNRRLRVVVTAGAAALALFVDALGLSVLLHRDHHVVASSPLFAGTTLEGTEVNGLMAEVLPFLSILRPKDSFYDTVAQHLEEAISARPGLRRHGDETVFVMAEDFEDVNGMARQVGLTAHLVNADFIALSGDLTFAGKPIESYLIDTVDYYSENLPVWFAPGLHDTQAIVQAAEARGWHVADGTAQQAAGVTLLAAPDPRISLVGDFGVGDVLRDPSVALDAFLADTTREACDSRPDFVLLHDHLLGQQIARSGCQRVAVLDGRSYQFLGPQRLETATGDTAYELTTGSAGGHVSTEPDPGDLQHPARFVILRYQPGRHRTSYAVVTVNPDASVTVTPWIDLRVPYADFLADGATRP